MNNSTLSSKRQYDLDWIRVLATLAVFLYHSSMFFNPLPWHVKNNHLDSGYIFAFTLFEGSWLMPIFFAVSGISVVYTFSKRSSKTYIVERIKRLFVPLLFGVIILTPPQVYMERISHHQFKGSFLSFLTHYFNGLYLDIGGSGNFAFFGLHLWYLLVLFIFSLITLPLFKKVQRRNAFGVVQFIGLPILLILIGVIKTVNLGGWDIAFYLIVFIYGFYFFSNQAFKEALRKTFILHFSLAVLSTFIFIYWFMVMPPTPGTISDDVFYSVLTLNCWWWLLSIFYLAERFLSHTNRFLKYGSEASMPFYVLHQPIIVFLGFLIRNLNWPPLLKLVFLVPAAFLVIMVIYHFVIRRFTILRLLFGMKGKRVLPVAEKSLPRNSQISG